jgi:hypothetical protein
MAGDVPEDVIRHVRRVFSRANVDATKALARQPAIHEEQLDFQVVAALDRVGPRVLAESGAAVEIETHWLGGRRHFGGRWEIADLALVAVFRKGGQLIWRKVALLQSKRLYARNVAISELDREYYTLGIGRLIDRPEPTRPATGIRKFEFSGNCVYGAMAAGSAQQVRIDEYMRNRRIPVFYSLYNPPAIPYLGEVPRRRVLEIKQADVRCGCRIQRAVDVHESLSRLPTGSTPSFVELQLREKYADGDDYDQFGWRLEVFVADEFLRCREGRKFVEQDDKDLANLLYERSGPIASAIVVQIDLPAD